MRSSEKTRGTSCSSSSSITPRLLTRYSIFYSIAKDILPSTNRFSPTHAFIHLLQEKDKLLTNFSQNIDNLEAKAGILPEKLIQCHGSFATATCVKCRHHVPGEEIYDQLKAGEVARCVQCLAQMAEQGGKRKRPINDSKSAKDRKKHFDGGDSSEDDEDDVPEAGVMKVRLCLPRLRLAGTDVIS